MRTAPCAPATAARYCRPRLPPGGDAHLSHVHAPLKRDAHATHTPRTRRALRRTRRALLAQVRQGEAARRTAWHNMLDPKQLGNKTLSPVELEALSSFLAANVSGLGLGLGSHPSSPPT